jgi:type IV pilus assembly protein PilB
MALKIGELLIKAKLINETQLAKALEEQRASGGRLGEHLVALEYVTEEDILDCLSQQYGVPSINLKHFDIDESIIRLIPADVARKYQFIPVSKTGATLTVAMTDPSNVFAMDDITFITGYRVEPVVASEEALREAIDKYYGTTHSIELKKVMEDLSTVEEASLEVLEEEEDLDVQDLEAGAEEAPVVRLVNLILTDALKRSASDIHIEPYEKSYRVRFRIDGVLYEIMNPPLKFRDAICSRIKILAKLDIAEKRLPQDGRIKLKMKFQGKVKELDFRVSTLPTLHGEKIVMRLLDKDMLMLDMTKLGFEKSSLKHFEEAIFQPYGMVLVTGPTGSGKTNTLYSAISRINSPEVNIMTAEDPVEFQLVGINQVQMKESIGLNFAAALRSFLRQDPNIVLDRDQGGAHRPPRALDPAHQRCTIHHQPPHEHGHRALPGRDLGQSDRRAAADPPRLREVQATGGSSAAGAAQRRVLGGRGAQHRALSGARLRRVQSARLQRPHRYLRSDGRHRRRSRAHPVGRVSGRAEAQGDGGGYDRIEAIRSAENPRRHHHD